MSVNDDYVQSGSDSFWELGKYSRTVKRAEHGQHLCIQMRKLIEERSEMEKKYALNLRDWSKRWNAFLDKDLEYGTTKGAWKGMLTEADQVADLHDIMGDKLVSEVIQSIKTWQKENYHKSMMHFKEVKEFEDQFKKAQKPWSKNLSKVHASKKDYHASCRSEKSTTNQENNARGDSTVSQDQLKKLQDKLQKCQSEVENNRLKYQATLNDLNQYNAKYIEDMSEVYNRCQDFEQKRLDFFKTTMFKIHDCLDLSVEARYSQIYTNLHSTIGNLDPSKDLKWWSTNHGVDMAMAWPTFEDYSPELQSISKRGKMNMGVDSGGITITSIKHHSRDNSYDSYSNDQAPAYRDSTAQPQPPPQQQQQQNYYSQVSSTSNGAAPISGPESSSKYDHALNPFGEDEDEEEEEEEKEVRVQKKEESRTVADRTQTSKEEQKNQGESPAKQGDNPFGDDMDPELEPEDDGEVGSTGWPVRALYDYNQTEGDELDFKAGDVFTQVADVDEMGWCKGQINGRVGYYPKNYAERI